MKQSMALLFALIVGCSSPEETRLATVIETLRPVATISNAGAWAPIGAPTIHEALDEDVSQAPMPVGDNTDPSIARATGAGTRKMKLQYGALASTEGTVTAVTWAIVYVNDGSPPALSSWAIEAFADSVQYGVGSVPIADPTIPALYLIPITGLSIPVGDFVDPIVDMGLGQSGAGPATFNNTFMTYLLVIVEVPTEIVTEICVDGSVDRILELTGSFAVIQNLTGQFGLVIPTGGVVGGLGLSGSFDVIQPVSGSVHNCED